jgi:hypothetical protein
MKLLLPQEIKTDTEKEHVVEEIVQGKPGYGARDSGGARACCDRCQ